jgi:hypothetical protein
MKAEALLVLLLLAPCNYVRGDPSTDAPNFSKMRVKELKKLLQARPAASCPGALLGPRARARRG